MLEGQGVDTCALQWILPDTRIEAGRPVLTAEDPLSSVPPFLLVGRISDASPQAGPYLNVRVRPALHFSNLTHVHVYKSRPAPPAEAPRRRRN